MSVVDNIIRWVNLYKFLMKRLNETTFSRKGEYHFSGDIISEDMPDRVFPIHFNLRMLYELAMGGDLSSTKIHIGPEADHIASKQGADAVTIGSDIYFSAGKYSEDTDEGIALLSHELVHVQQHVDHREMRYKEDVEALEHEAYRNEIQEGHGSGESLKDSDLTGYSQTQREIVYIIHLDNGKNLKVPAKEYESFVALVKEKVYESLEEDLRFSGEDQRIEIINKLSNWLG